MHDDDIPLSTLFSWLDSLYLRAIKGGLGTDSAKELAHHYLTVFPDIQQAAENLSFGSPAKPQPADSLPVWVVWWPYP